MPTAETLQYARDWLDKLQAELHAARDEHTVKDYEYVQTEALDDIRDMQPNLEQQVKKIEHGAKALDWTGEQAKQDYLDDVEEHKQTLISGVEKVVNENSVPEERFRKMEASIRELRDCIDGILEDK